MPRYRDHGLWLLGLWAACSAGCVRGSLGTDTGETLGGRWSVADVQQVHVGETVAFNFILGDPVFGGWQGDSSGADYAVLLIDNQRLESDRNLQGMFEFTYRLEGLSPGGQLEVLAEGYETRGHRDFMKIRGVWRASLSGRDQPDRRVGSDTVSLEIYQCEIDHPIDPVGLIPDVAACRLVIHGDGEPQVIMPDKPNLPGFNLEPPASDTTQWRLRYRLSADQVRKRGTTTCVLQLRAADGSRRDYDIVLQTP